MVGVCTGLAVLWIGWRTGGLVDKGWLNGDEEMGDEFDGEGGGILLVDVYGFGDLHGGIDRVADFELGQLG
jgi:hypothetical protein